MAGFGCSLTVLSQDCDLAQDHAARESGDIGGAIPSILFCEVETAEQLLSNIQGRDIKKRIQQNSDERYQFLQRIPVECDALRQGLPELGIDFRRYFTLPAEEVYFQITRDAKRRCHLVSPYLEHISARFTRYLGRVGLPLDHQSEPQ